MCSPQTAGGRVLALQSGVGWCESIGRRWYKPVPGRRAGTPDLQRLTYWETEVLRSLSLGLSNAEIAAAVKSYVPGVLSNLGLRDRAQAVVSPTSTGWY